MKAIRIIKNIVFGKREHHQPVQEPYLPVDLNFTNSDSRNCVILIDASGSMSSKDWKPSRLKAAINAAEAFINRLAIESPESNIAIVAYDNKARIALNLTPASHSIMIINSLKNIRLGGCTNIPDALSTALQILSGVHGNSQVILLTDGHSNVGGSPKHIADRLREYATIETVGIGKSPKCVDEKLLKYIASSHPDGTKRYRWIGDSQQLIKHFHNLAGRIERVKQ